jgi:hypothetical protein
VLFSVLYGFVTANFVAFNGDALHEFAAQLMVLAEKQRLAVPIVLSHRVMGSILTFTGDIAKGRAHYDRAITLYDPVQHRPLVTRFGQDTRVVAFAYRALALWLLGYPASALADPDRAVMDAREIGQGATYVDVCTEYYVTDVHLLRELRCGKCASGRSCGFGR